MMAASRRMLSSLVVAAGAALLLSAVFIGRMGPGDEDGGTASGGGLSAASASSQGVHYHPGRPAHIHAGSCDDLGEVAFPLNPVGAGEMTGPAMTGVAAMAVVEGEGEFAGMPAEVGRITLDTPLREIAAGRYALNVQISEYDYGNDIACGAVGSAIEDGVLSFDLRERNGSGFSGLARLTADGDETLVTVYVVGGGG